MTNAPHPEWIAVVRCENAPGHPQPMAAVRGWLRERGIDWMPFAADEVRWSLACGLDSEGLRRGRYEVRVRADALWRLGLHPDQPTAHVLCPPSASVVARRRGTGGDVRAVRPADPPRIAARRRASAPSRRQV
jgi:hypothetical protein